MGVGVVTKESRMMLVFTNVGLDTSFPISDTEVAVSVQVTIEVLDNIIATMVSSCWRMLYLWPVR